MDSAKRVMNGTWGEVWLDGEYVSECYGLQAKVSMNKEDISLCRQMAKDKKVTSTSMHSLPRITIRSFVKARLHKKGCEMKWRFLR